MVGNDIPMFITNPSSHITAGGEFLASDAAPFKDMEPEMTHSFEAGIEARFLKNRIGLKPLSIRRIPGTSSSSFPLCRAINMPTVMSMRVIYRMWGGRFHWMPFLC